MKLQAAIMTDDPNRLFYTAGEMAAMCGVHRNTWLSWVKAGEAPQPIIVNSVNKWLAKDVKKWLKDKKRESCQASHPISA